jgi:hypothetical protein
MTVVLSSCQFKKGLIAWLDWVLIREVIQWRPKYGLKCKSIPTAFYDIIDVG